MTELIKLNEYPVKDFLKKLLQDKTTKMNIKFATSTYETYGYSEKSQMTEGAVLGFSSCDIQPRVCKSLEEQGDRTRKKAEVFTPAWVVNKMNNHCDTEWFGKTNVFNFEEETEWIPTTEKITFPKDKSWKDYIDSRRLEITCGEAPYIASRYDSTTGEIIPIEKRIGILDRKMRVVDENTLDEREWLIWAYRAFQSVYGYEFQGDNLLIARINLLMTFCDCLKARWNREATKSEITKIINIICWNFWQMDGLKRVVPYGIPHEEHQQFNLWRYLPNEAAEKEEENKEGEACLIYDWRYNRSKLFKEIEKRGSGMKFDFVIGNPPYQEEFTTDGNKSYAAPVYNDFMSEAFNVADKVELIHPARFLFNAGSTPKAWNQKMLSDEHFKVLYHEQNSSKVFPNTDIKGGVAITYRDSTKNFGAIEIFTPFSQLNSMMRKVEYRSDFVSLSTIVFSAYSNKFTRKMHEDYPNAVDVMSKGHAFDLKSNIFEKLPEIFIEKEPDDGEVYCKFIGLIKNKRMYRYIKRKYLEDTINLEKYKVLMPAANGSGAIGEILSTPLIGEPLIGEPLIGGTETFISIGSFETLYEAEALLKYVKSKFARALLGILKITQHVTPEKWTYVPLQDFTSKSDIDWSVSVAEIDKQLYKKYGLSSEEIEFIETHVKEME